MENLIINSQYHFAPPNENDIPFYVQHFRDKEIYDNTLMIPFPYSEADAFWFLDYCAKQKLKFGHELNFSIRNKYGELIGGVGFHGKNLHPPIAHRDEIGYWLAKPFWNQGIMSMALPVLIEYGEKIRGIKRFEAPVFSFNIASQKVLLKNGFHEEGLLKSAFVKDGNYFDGKLFALVK